MHAWSWAVRRSYTLPRRRAARRSEYPACEDDGSCVGDWYSGGVRRGADLIPVPVCATARARLYLGRGRGRACRDSALARAAAKPGLRGQLLGDLHRARLARTAGPAWRSDGADGTQGVGRDHRRHGSAVRSGPVHPAAQPTMARRRADAAGRKGRSGGGRRRAPAPRSGQSSPRPVPPARPGTGPRCWRSTAPASACRF
jgi:hypothetical protein